VTFIYFILLDVSKYHSNLIFGKSPQLKRGGEG